MLRTVCEDAINAEDRLIFNLLRIIGFVICPSSSRLKNEEQYLSLPAKIYFFVIILLK